ncbi:hypothetical protein [Arsenophonus endosymbiont of Aleurodicus floccissimus]|uniref:hypothetical protein n=1 Tax=Arsenophonus endosymbiont of Aleurodicus floccissimus TaxID=2152761 RepID=UPI001EDE7E4D|nr:hypothetical protein [Arsenophonus endosymbiont of Aleurodicus floccissimus]
MSFDADRVVPTADENRPRNIAFNYIVRAAESFNFTLFYVVLPRPLNIWRDANIHTV